MKIECYSVDENGYRDKIGYILLSIRSAQIIQRGKETDIKFNWNTFLGVRGELNACKPKLYLTLFLREANDFRPLDLPLVQQCIIIVILYSTNSFLYFIILE